MLPEECIMILTSFGAASPKYSFMMFFSLHAVFQLFANRVEQEAFSHQRKNKAKHLVRLL